MNDFRVTVMDSEELDELFGVLAYNEGRKNRREQRRANAERHEKKRYREKEAKRRVREEDYEYEF